MVKTLVIEVFIQSVLNLFVKSENSVGPSLVSWGTPKDTETSRDWVSQIIYFINVI